MHANEKTSAFFSLKGGGGGGAKAPGDFFGDFWEKGSMVLTFHWEEFRLTKIFPTDL